MRKFPAPSSGGVTVLALAVAMLPPTTVVAAVAPEGDGFTTQRALAKEQRSQGHFAQSARLFAAAYDELSEEAQGGLKGEIAVSNAVDDFKRAQQNAPDDLSLLEDELVLLKKFFASPARTEAPPALSEELERVDKLIQELRPSDEPTEAGAEQRTEQRTEPQAAKNDEAPVDVDSARAPVRSDPSLDAESAERDWLGLGLVIGGGTMLGVGVGIGAGYFTIRSGANALVDAGGDDFAPGTDARRQYLEAEQARARPFLISGAVLAGVGVGTAIGGVVRLLIRRRRRPTNEHSMVRLVPVVSQESPGFRLVGRF